MRLPIAALGSWLSPVPAAEEVARSLTAIGLEVEGREESSAGTVLEINVTPNRGDCLSVRGIARELCAALARPFAEPAPAPLPAALANSSLPIALNDPRCPRFLGVEIRGVNQVATPEAVKKLLESFGMRPVSMLVDAANLVMLELGQPLHTYDLKALRGGITVRAARAGEALVTLDGQKRELTPWTVKGQPFAPLLICDDKEGARPIGLAGVMGGGDTEIPDHAEGIYLEAAAFDAVAVRRVAKQFSLHSEASHRFERGVDPHLPKLAAARFLQLLKEWGAGGTVAGWRLAETVKPESRTVELRPAALQRLLGVALPADFVAARFAALGLKAAGGERWTVPSWRPDLAIEEDLIEEAGRHYGYDRIGETLPSGIDPAPGRDAAQNEEAALRARAIQDGFSELISIPFAPAQGTPGALAIANPIWLDHPEMTADPEAALRRTMAHNLRADTFAAEPSRVRLFELRKRYLRAGDRAEERVTLHLALAFPIKAPLQDAALAARDCAARVGAPGGAPAWSREADGPGGVVRFSAGPLAVTLAPSVNWPEFDAAHPVRLALIEIAPGAAALRLATQAPPRFPAVVRDLNFLVPDGLAYGRIREATRGAGARRLESVDNLDRGFTGKGIPDGHRALAVRFTFRNPDDTLTTWEAEDDLARIRAALEKIGVTVRG